MLMSKFDRTKVEEVEMNSELAKEYLEKYGDFIGQRKEKQFRLNHHKNTIIDGMMAPTPVVIGCHHEENDRRRTIIQTLIDGYHRLTDIANLDTNDTITVVVIKVWAEKEVIRQLYGYYDNPKSTRSLEDILRWKITMHHNENIRNRWSLDNLKTLAYSLPYASGHYFAGKKKFPFNALPKGITCSKDEFLSDSLDVELWWIPLDYLDEFINGLKDREDYGRLNQQLGYVIYGTFLRSIRIISERGRRGRTLNKTLDFWKAVVDAAADSGNLFVNVENNIIKSLWKDIIVKIRADENDGKLGKGFSPVPIFYAFCQAHKSWMNDINTLGLGITRARSVTKEDILNKFYGKGESIYPVHPTYRKNRYWEEKL